MAVTIISARQEIAGASAIPFGNAKAEVVKLSGTIANTDTGTYTPKNRTLKDAAAVPLIVGLPYGITAVQSASTGVITFTCVIAAGFTSLDVKILILCGK